MYVFNGSKLYWHDMLTFCLSWNMKARIIKVVISKRQKHIVYVYLLIFKCSYMYSTLHCISTCIFYMCYDSLTKIICVHSLDSWWSTILPFLYIIIIQSATCIRGVYIWNVMYANFIYLNSCYSNQFLFCKVDLSLNLQFNMSLFSVFKYCDATLDVTGLNIISNSFKIET